MDNDKQKSAECLADRIINWIKNQGYPLEMIVASTLRKAGFTTSLSDYYQDPETREYREIDITAVRWSNEHKPVIAQVCFRIECKRIKDKPWVVFVPDAEPNVFLPLTSISSEIFRAFIFNVFKKADYMPKLLKLPLFRSDAMGYGVIQAFAKDNQDMPYKALMSAGKASVARALELDKLPRPTQQFFCGIVFPVIVIDGSLFEARLDEYGDIKVQEVVSSYIYWKGMSPWLSSPLIPIISKPALDQFVIDMNITTTSLLSISEEFMTELKEIAEEIWAKKKGM